MFVSSEISVFGSFWGRAFLGHFWGCAGCAVWGRWDNVRENVVKLLLIFVNYKFETKCAWGVGCGAEGMERREGVGWEWVGARGRLFLKDC